LQKGPRRPFFLFVNFWDPHFDYIPPPPYDTRFDPDYTGTVTGERLLTNPAITDKMPPRDLEHLRALYDGEIGWTDEHFGAIVDQLESLKLLDSTIAIVISDCGTALLDHGLKGQRNSLFDELLRIPLIIRYPARIEAGSRFEQQVRTIDLLPTVNDLLGLPPEFLMGQTLAPLFAGGELERREPAVSELSSMGARLQAFRIPQRKTIWDLDADSAIVFDLRADPGELAPVSDRGAPILAGAKADTHWSRAFLDAFRKRYPQTPTTSELPPQLIERFAAMGYVQGDKAPHEATPSP
jgi:arylsulfatase A-like enzyme